MPGWKDAMRGAGLQASRRDEPHGPGRPGGQQGNSGRPGGSGGSGENAFPAGYPQYFNAEGHTRVELLMREAENLAKQFDSDSLRRSQLRAFYDHAKRQLQRLQYGASFAEIHADVAKLKAFAADRAGRAENALPSSFKQFIDRNVNAVRTQEDFQKGFMPHFEAVVAYCAGIKD